MTALFYDDIIAFKEMMYQQRSTKTEKAMKRRKREVMQAQKRIVELDRIFKRIYEGDISGVINHDRFLKLSAEYEAEQRELEEKVKTEQQEVDTYEQNKNDFDSGKGRREAGTESGYCFQLCRRNQFPFCRATETARRIETQKNGTSLMIGTIPLNLKLLPYHRKL